MSHILCASRGLSSSGFAPFFHDVNLLTVSPALGSGAAWAAPTASCGVCWEAWSKFVPKSSYFPQTYFQSCARSSHAPCWEQVDCKLPSFLQGWVQALPALYFQSPFHPSSSVVVTLGLWGLRPELKGKRAAIIHLACSVYADKCYMQAERVTYRH